MTSARRAAATPDGKGVCPQGTGLLQTAICTVLYVPYEKRLSHSQADFCFSCKSGFSGSRPFPERAGRLDRLHIARSVVPAARYNEPLLRRYTQIKRLTSDRLIWIECKQRVVYHTQNHKHNHNHHRFLLQVTAQATSVFDLTVHLFRGLDGRVKCTNI